MNVPAYKYCSVPLCKNSTLHNPDKLFIHVPKSKDLRNKWLTLSGRDPKNTSDKSTIYFCGDHFNVPEDMENYMEYHVMKSVKQVRLKANCLPTKFSCQLNRSKRTVQSISKSATIKKQCKALVQEAEIAFEDSVTSPTRSNIDTAQSSSSPEQADELEVKFKDKLIQAYPDTENEHIQAYPDTENKHIQASFTVRYRSKSTQNTVAMRNKETSPIASHSKSSATSTFQTSLLPNDMTNYMRYRVMGSVKRVMVKPGCVPSKFDCQKSKSECASAITSDADPEEDSKETILNSFEDQEFTTDKTPPDGSETESETEFNLEDVPQTTDEVTDDVSMYDQEDDKPLVETSLPEDCEIFTGFQCSVCDRDINGFRYTCVQCSDLFLCGACEHKRAHHQHYVLRVPADRPHTEVESVLATIRTHLMQNLDPIADLHLDPGTSVKLEIKSENDEDMRDEITDETVEHEELNDPAPTEPIQQDPITENTGLKLLCIENNETPGIASVQRNICSPQFKVISGPPVTEKPKAAIRNKIIKMSDLQKITIGKKIYATATSSAVAKSLGAKVLSVKPLSAARLRILQLPPQPRKANLEHTSQSSSDKSIGAPENKK